MLLTVSPALITYVTLTITMRGAITLTTIVTISGNHHRGSNSGATSF